MNGLNRAGESAASNLGAATAATRIFLDPVLCFVADEDDSHRNFISLVLQSHGLETCVFGKADELRRALLRRTPDLVLLDASSSMASAINTVRALAERSYRGPVQLMGTGAIDIGSVKLFGER